MFLSLKEKNTWFFLSMCVGCRLKGTLSTISRVEPSRMLLFSCCSPKSEGPTRQYWNSILLEVSVPVLSEKMYWIWPSSSLRVELKAFE